MPIFQVFSSKKNSAVRKKTSNTLKKQLWY